MIVPWYFIGDVGLYELSGANFPMALWIGLAILLVAVDLRRRRQLVSRTFSR
jgi:hypothetical protein